MTKRAALYARVSTAHQEQEQTIASQVAALERAGTELQLSIPQHHRYIDDGFSGSRLDRPALDTLRDAAADGFLDVVLIHCPDRLARNYVHQQVLIEELTKRGVEVHFVERPIGERAEDRLLLQMQGVIAEYERAKIIERTRRGTRHKVRSGQLLPFSKPPYGYAIVRSADTRPQLVIDEVEAAHVRSMFRWIIEEGLGVFAVAKRLNEIGARPRQRDFWVTGSVYRIVTNTVYAGTAIFGKRESVEPKRPRHPGAYRSTPKSSVQIRPASQWIEVSVPAIIDEKTRQAALGQLARNKSLAKRNNLHDYLLRTLVVCGECNRRMTARCHKDGRGYQYFCYACDHRDPVVTGSAKRCKARRVHANQLDKIVWEALMSWIQTPDMLLRELDAWRAHHSSAPAKTKELTRLQKLERQLELQVQRLVDAYQRGAISVDELKGRRERLEADRQATHARIQDLTGEQLDSTRLQRLGEDLEEFASSIRAGLHELDFAQRQRLVRLLIERVVVTGDDVAIEHAIPLTGRFSAPHPSLH